MSIVRPIVRNIESPIVKSIDQPIARYLPEFNGTSQYGDLNSDWAPTSVNWRVGFDFQIEAAATGATQGLITGTATGGAARILLGGGGAIQLNYRDSGGIFRQIVGPIVSDGQRLTSYVRSSGAGAELWLGGVMVGSNPAVASGTTFNRINANAAPAEYAAGKGYGLQFIDESGIQDGIYLQGDGVGTYVDFGAGITLGVGDTVEFDYKHASSGNFQPIVFQSSGTVFRLGITAADKVDFNSPTTTVRVNGNAVIDDAFTFMDGMGYELEMEALAPVVVGYLLSNVAGTVFGAGVIANLKVTKANGDTCIYALSNDGIIDNGDGTATAVQSGTSSAPDAIVRNFTAANNLVAVPNNTRNYPCHEAGGNQLIDLSGDGSTNITLIGGVQRVPA